MDTSGFIPQLSDDDPLFEIAEYTQLMKTQFTVTSPTTVTLTNGWTQWSNGGWGGIQIVRMGKLAIISGAAGKASWGAGDLIATLPVELRPAITKLMGVNCELESNGNLRTAGPAASGTSATTLSITYFIA